jgi:PAS domain S-box-containing protein
MQFLQRTSTRLQTRLIGYMGVGSLLLIFIAGYISDYASRISHKAEDSAVAVLENIAQARFEISLLGVSTTRYLDSLDPALRDESNAIKRRIDERVQQMADALPTIQSDPYYKGVLKDIADFAPAFEHAAAQEQALGHGGTVGMRDAFSKAAAPLTKIVETGDARVISAILAVIVESNRINVPGAEFEATPLLSAIDTARTAIDQSGTLSTEQKRLHQQTLAQYRDTAASFIALIEDQIRTRLNLRSMSRSASTNFAGLAASINTTRDQLRTKAEQAQRLITWLNIVFSALVAVLFLLLATAIGRRVRAQADTISSNEARFRQLVEAMADFAVEIDADLVIRHYFQKPTFAPSVKPETLIGRRLFDKHDDDLHTLHFDEKALNHYLETRTPFRDFDYKITTSAGYIGWRRCYGTPFFNESGEFAGFRILSLDCTAQKESERLRRESDAAYRAIATAAFGAFYRIDTYGRILSLEGTRNQPSAILNMQRSGRFIWDALMDLGIRYPAEIDLKAHILAGEEFNDVEVELHNTDGTSRGWYIHRGVPIRDQNGDATGYVIAVANITRQKNLERETRAKTQELERIIETMPGVFFRLIGSSVSNAVLEYVSPGIVDILGYKPSEITGQPGLNLTAPDDRETSYFESNRSAGSAFQEKRVRLRRKDGSYATVIEKPVEIATRPDGSKIIEGLLIDISDLAQRDVEIANRRRQMEAIVSNLPGWIYGFEVKDGTALQAITTGNCEKISGFTGDELIDLFYHGNGDYAHPDDKVRLQQNWQDILACDEKGGSYDNRYRIKHKDGHLVWVSDRGRYVRDSSGTVHVDGIVLDITAEASAQDEAQIIESAVAVASDGVCVFDREGTIVYANTAFNKIIEKPIDASMRGVNIAATGQFVNPNDQTVRKIINNALQQTGNYRGELEWLSNSNRKGLLDVTVTRTATGHDVLIARDVTDARLASDRRSRLNAAAARVGIARGGFLSDFRSGIQEMTEIAANALDTTRVGVWLFDDDNHESYTAIDIFDRRTSKHSEGIVHHRSDYPLYFAALDLMRNIVAQDALNDPITRELTESYFKPYGITGLLDTPIFRAGKVLGVLCIERSGPIRAWLDEEIAFATVMADSIAFGLETEERKVAERRVVTVNGQLNRVVKALDSSQDNIIIEDEDGTIAYMNARAIQNSAVAQSGGTPVSGRGMRFGDLFPDFHSRREQAAHKILQDLNEHGAWEDEIEIHHVNGRTAYMEVRIARLPDGGQICVATDVTGRRRQAERELGLRTQLAEAQKMEAIGRLAGGIAHDFNNIIAAVAAYASVISGDTCSNSQHASYATKIRAICARASDIVKQILLFAKAKTATHDPIVVGDIVVEAQELLTASLPASVDVRVINNAQDSVVLGASAQLLQVLLNLGLNSGDAIKEEQGYIEISLDRMIADDTDADGTDKIITRTEGGVVLSRSLKGSIVAGRTYVRICVRDNGPGISNEVLERIYEPFFTTKEKSKGSGLGLPVVYSIITAHEGAIEIRTALGHGTRFLIYLPASEAQVKLPAPEKLGTGDGRGRVLIVDDEADLADAISILLSKAGFEAAPVYDPLDAIDLFAEDPSAWDLVLTDQVMPKMKGVALAKKLLKLRPDLPIILYTGYSDSASEEVVKAAGIRTMLFKPVEGPLLIQHITAALKSRAH